MEKDKKAIIKQFSKYVQKYKAKFWKDVDMPTVMGRREGIYFWDENGKRFINCHCNGGVFNLGHLNSEVKEALIKGMETYDIGNHHLASQPRAELAKKFVKSFGYGPDKQRMEKVIFGVSGGEAIDLAIKMARGYTRKTTILSMKGGYHGHTGLAIGTAKDALKETFNLTVPGFRQMDVHDLDRIEDFIDDNTAAVLLETSLATFGFYVIPFQTMQHVRKVCTEKKVVFIMDEVQTGMGRTGKVWGFQKYNIMPDMMVAGKGLSGSLYPMSLTAFKKKYETVFKYAAFGHVSTMGGAELGCLAAHKTLEIVMRKSLQKNVNRLAAYFHHEIQELIRKKNSKIVHLRHLGLAMGIVFENEATGLAMVCKCYENGLYCFFSGYDMRAIQFKPPLITTMEQAKEIMQIFKKSLSELDKDYIVSIAKKFASLSLLGGNGPQGISFHKTLKKMQKDLKKPSTVAMDAPEKESTTAKKSVQFLTKIK